MPLCPLCREGAGETQNNLLLRHREGDNGSDLKFGDGIRTASAGRGNGVEPIAATAELNCELGAAVLGLE